MERRTLPGTDLELSVVGMGCWTIGGTHWGPDRDDQRAVRTIHAALDAGINWFDTAPLYGHGHADRLLARALADRPQAIIATKAGVRWDGEHAESDLRPQHIRADCEASLARLGREPIDLLQVHWPCQRGTPLEDSLGELLRLKQSGKIRHFGLCNYGPEDLARAREVAPVASLQTPLSLLRREYEGALAEECLRPVGGHPLGVVAYEGLCRGLLTGRYRQLPHFDESDMRSRDPRFSGRRFAHARALVTDLRKVALRVGVPLPAIALGWVLSRPGITAVLAGARRPEQITENAIAGRITSNAKLWSVVDRVAALHGGS